MYKQNPVSFSADIIFFLCILFLFISCTTNKLNTINKKADDSEMIMKTNSEPPDRQMNILQIEADNPNIAYVRNENQIITKIDYNVSKNGFEYSKQFSISENNPYNMLPYSKGQVHYGNFIYNVNGNIKDFLQGYDSLNYNPLRGFNDNNPVEMLYSTDLVSFSEDKKIHIISYNLIAFSADVVKGVVSSMLILNEEGELIKELKDLDININYTGITTDGKYLFVCFGYEDENGYVLIPGYRIYDLTNNNIVVENKNDNHEYGGTVKNNLIIITHELVNEGEPATKYEFFNLYERKKYSRIMKFDEQNFIEITREGCKIQNKDGYISLSFEKDFNKEEL